MPARKITQEYENLYRSEFSKARAFAYMRTTDNDLADDFTQEAFLRLWRTLCEGKQPHSLKTFLYTILKNIIIDHYRKKKSLSLDAISRAMEERDPNGFQVPDERESASTRAEARDALEYIQKVVSTAYLRAFLEVRIKGRRYADVAEDLGLTVNAVTVRVSRAEWQIRESLRKNVKPERKRGRPRLLARIIMSTL